MNRYSKKKFNVLCVLATTLVASSAARADTIFLQCGTDAITVDLTNNTVNNIPATINATAIDWSPHIGATTTPGLSATEQNHIDRTTGTFTSTVTYNFNGQISYGHGGPYSCTAGPAPATKF
jgi:hypothetical protein